ncbi:hypothetical protein GCM10027276_14420 [Comamonas piscis]
MLCTHWCNGGSHQGIAATKASAGSNQGQWLRKRCKLGSDAEGCMRSTVWPGYCSSWNCAPHCKQAKWSRAPALRQFAAPQRGQYGDDREDDEDQTGISQR